MVAGHASRTVRASGKLVVGPTNLSAAFPYGGTQVGRSKLVVVQSFGEPYRIEGEGIGRATDVLEPEKRHMFSCILRGWDDDAVDLLLNDGDTVGGTSGHAVYSVPGSATPGRSALSRAIMILYVPDDLVHVPAVLVYAGIPYLSPGAEMAFQSRAELGVPLVAECFRDGNGNTLSIGRLADLSLT